MISACIIAIGDELLNGFTSDTNSDWIKNQAARYELNITKSTIIPDDQQLIDNEISNCLSMGYDMIFISGGLGTTHDDITKQSLSKFLNLKLTIHQGHKNYLLDL